MLSFFIPFHDECVWTLHAMSNHLVGEDVDGSWASCYGFVQWRRQENPDLVNRATVLYRDRLSERDGVFVITRRKLDVLISEPAVPIPPTQAFGSSVLDLADMRWR